jgi:hypothetical protein
MRKQDASANWGHCGHCRFFGSPAKAPLDGEQAGCNEPTLTRFELRVFGMSGCNHFELRPGLSGEVEQPRREVRATVR